MPRLRDALAPAVVFAAALAVNLLTAAPTVLEGDGAELQAVALLGGVPHPSGYPSFVLLGRLFALLPGDAAFRITAMCAACGAAALVVVVRMLRELGASSSTALAGAAVYGSSFTLRWSSIHAEVYALTWLLAALALWRTLVALRSGAPRDHAIAACATGLMLTGHLATAPAALAIGAFLLFAPPGPFAAGGWRRATMALAGFLAGLTPVLYLVWADQVPHAMNYLDATLELDANQFGLTRATFDEPWERIPWLLLGDQSARSNFLGHPRILARHLIDAGGVVWLFELGPLAIVPAALGAWRLWRTRRLAAALAAAVVMLTFGFTAAFTYGKLQPIFLAVATLLVAVAVALGLEPLAARFLPRAASWARSAAALAGLAALILTPHALRLRGQERPIPPHGWRFEEEGPPRIGTLWPSLAGYREPRLDGEATLEAIPPGALVLGRWNEIMVLAYLCRVEGRRPDLTLDPFYHPWHLLRVARWQERHDLRQRPVVVLYRVPEVMPHLDRPDSVQVRGGHWIWIQRTPVRNLDAWVGRPRYGSASLPWSSGRRARDRAR